jgi:hypothetical protein
MGCILHLRKAPFWKVLQYAPLGRRPTLPRRRQCQVCNLTWARTVGLRSGALGARAPERRPLGAEITKLTLELLRQFTARIGDDFHRGFAQHRGNRGVAFPGDAMESFDHGVRLTGRQEAFPSVAAWRIGAAGFGVLSVCHMVSQIFLAPTPNGGEKFS